MAKINARAKSTERTHEGAPAIIEKPEAQLKRAVMACLLWENGFYESGEEIADRIKKLIPHCRPAFVSELAVEARTKMKLRHAPLFVVREMARLPEHKKYVQSTLFQVIQRADELAEFLAIYWKDGRQPLSGQVKKGLAKAFTKFSEYDLAKYNRDSAVKLRDVLFLCHAEPVDEVQGDLWKRLIDGKLATPDTWEVALSSGADKRETWLRLINEKKLGALAVLRNLRNMTDAGVHPTAIRAAISGVKTERVLPYRFIAAARYAPAFEPELEERMLSCMEGGEKLKGRTALLVDVSGSMDSPVSSKSDLMRMDAACGLAILLREMGNTDVYTFSSDVKRVPARRGFALRDAIVSSQPHSSTMLGLALQSIPRGEYDRVIVITDEQSHDAVYGPPAPLGYMVNVASNQNGVGYGNWMRITGWSEQIARFIYETENAQ